METNPNKESQSACSAPEQLYDPEKTQQIAETLCELLHPEYILLFGRMVGRTPHSEMLAYDLLVVTEGITPYKWYDAKRYLKLKLPFVGHGAPYVNIYLHTQHEIEVYFIPFFHLARREGLLLYCRPGRRFKRPGGKAEFGQFAATAERYAGIFLPLADRLVRFAAERTDPECAREAAFAVAQAAVYYFRTLFFVYHGFQADTCDIRMLFLRLRTLSAEFPVLFQSDECRSKRVLHHLARYISHARYDPDFRVDIEELTGHVRIVERLGKVVTALCRSRILLYEKRA